MQEFNVGDVVRFHPDHCEVDELNQFYVVVSPSEGSNRFHVVHSCDLMKTRRAFALVPRELVRSHQVIKVEESLR